MTQPIALDKVLWLRKSEGIAASGVIPTEAEFFQDHFPGFPVLPGVLALEMLKQTAQTYLKRYESERSSYRIKSLKVVKFSQYLKPGDSWESNLELIKTNDNITTWKGKLSSQGKLAVSARLVVEQAPLKQLVMMQA